MWIDGHTDGPGAWEETDFCLGTRVMECPDFDLEIPICPLQNNKLVLNSEDGRALARTFIAFPSFFGVPLLEFRVYVSDAPPSHFPILFETAAAVAEALFVGMPAGTIIVDWIQVRQANSIIILIAGFRDVSGCGFPFDALWTWWIGVGWSWSAINCIRGRRSFYA